MHQKYSVNWKISRTESQKCSFLQNLQLGNQTPLDNTNIDLLIGVDTIGDGEKKRDKSCSLAASKSLFGYLVSGPSMNDGSLKQVNTEAVAQRCSVKKVFLEISQNSQENACAATLLKKRLWHRYFPVNFAKFLKTPFLTGHLRWLLLLTQHMLWKLSSRWLFQWEGRNFGI